ncbi:hypothetical protein KC328_g102 [Hortaea werneckii]|nr:hypothetical protein KC328_g102 [Hortaea werneckii]
MLNPRRRSVSAPTRNRCHPVSGEINSADANQHRLTSGYKRGLSWPDFGDPESLVSIPAHRQTLYCVIRPLLLQDFWHTENRIETHPCLCTCACKIIVPEIQCWAEFQSVIVAYLVYESVPVLDADCNGSTVDEVEFLRI